MHGPTQWYDTPHTSRRGRTNDDAHVMGVRNRVSNEIVCVRWREHIHPDHLHEIHMSEDG
jgi:hypothetical protein